MSELTEAIERVWSTNNRGALDNAIALAEAIESHCEALQEENEAFKAKLQNLLAENERLGEKCEADSKSAWENFRMSEIDRKELQALNDRISKGQKVWVARDNDGELNLYEDKPMRAKEFDGHNKLWVRTANVEQGHDYGEVMNLANNQFPTLKWEDSPIQVVLLEVEVSK